MGVMPKRAAWADEPNEAQPMIDLDCRLRESELALRTIPLPTCRRRG